MTEIVAKRLWNVESNHAVFCAVDNHTSKNKRYFTILYTAKTKEELDRYMKEKGI